MAPYQQVQLAHLVRVILLIVSLLGTALKITTILQKGQDGSLVIGNGPPTTTYGVLALSFCAIDWLIVIQSWQQSNQVKLRS
jgi:hypothetical protein